MTTTLTRPCRTCALHVAPGEPHDGGAGNSWREPGKGVGMKTEQPIKCPYCGHTAYRDFTDSDAYVPQVERCSKCGEHFAVRLHIRYEVQTQPLFDTPVQQPAPPTTTQQQGEWPGSKCPRCGV
jgi:hypothetical protein